MSAPPAAGATTGTDLAPDRQARSSSSGGPLRTACFHCFSGISGDMALGALVDAGADPVEVERMCRRLPVEGWELQVERVLRAGLAGTRVRVEVAPSGHPHRRAADILGMLDQADLPPRVNARARATFTLLAEVEGRLHGVSPEDVHFHEVGAVDSIVDVVGVCAGLELLGIDELASSPVAQGTGTIRAAHGVLPNPPPAVVALLARAGIPAYGLDVPFELTTPTGAALLAALGTRFGPLPDVEVVASGFGAGGRDLEGRPNLLQVVVGRAAAPPSAPGREGHPAIVLEATLDDATGEVLGHALQRLLDEGAFDAWIVPVTMKKSRPGHIVTVLCDPVRAPALREVLRAETGTFGVRATTVERWPAARHFEEVEVLGERLRVKVTAGRAKVEHDDAVAAARRLGLPLREVAARAESAWQSSAPRDSDHPSDHASDLASDFASEHASPDQ
jgi:uncharacterized protein (TIGR00299 family) protein